MGSRKQPRIKSILPVRISGTDSSGRPFMELVHTIDVSHSGVRIAGVNAALVLGDIVTIQCRHRKSKYEVTWADRQGTSKTWQIGLRSMEKSKDIWQLQLSDLEVQDMGQMPERRSINTRAHKRLATTAIVDYIVVGTNAGGRAKVRDLSLTGCFLSLASLPEVGTELEMVIQLGDSNANVFGLVRVSRPPSGVGVEFTRFRSPEDQMILEETIIKLQERAATQSAG